MPFSSGNEKVSFAELVVPLDAVEQVVERLHVAPYSEMTVRARAGSLRVHRHFSGQERLVRRQVEDPMA